MFYDAVQTFFESYIRRVIDRATDAAEKGQGLEPQDVNVLELLLLLKWDKDLKTTVGNVVTLMTDDVRADRMALRESVQASLDRLVHENYVSRNGDTYQFLTDDEQDIARQISRPGPGPRPREGEGRQPLLRPGLCLRQARHGREHLRHREVGRRDARWPDRRPSRCAS